MLGEFRRAKGWPAAFKRSLASLRVLAFPGLMRRMSADGYLRLVERKRGSGRRALGSVPLHLAPGLPGPGPSRWAQRFEAALYHYRYEAATFNEAMLDQMYSPQGF